jgi:glutathione reductase (NADPH)
MTWNFASIAEALKDGKHYSYDIPGDIKFDFAKFKKDRDEQVKKLNGAYERNWNRDGIDLVHGTATFKSPKEIEVTFNDGSEKAIYTAPHICIAVGGHPIKPDIPGASHGIDSDGFFDIEKLPKKMAFVGAGYIAVEMAGMMAAIGVETHMFIRGETFLRTFDPMIQNTVTQRYIDAGVHIHKKHKSFKKIELIKDGPPGDKI